MRKFVATTFILASSLLSLTTNVALANEAKWVCTKDGKNVKVKGDKADDKKKDCEAQGGSWEKATKHKAEGGSAAPAQSSGGGGSW